MTYEQEFINPLTFAPCAGYLCAGLHWLAGSMQNVVVLTPRRSMCHRESPAPR